MREKKSNSTPRPSSLVPSSPLVPASKAMLYQTLATAVAVIHFAFIVFVIAGGFLALRWPAVKWIHLPAALWGALIEIGGWICPLTILENVLPPRVGRLRNPHVVRHQVDDVPHVVRAQSPDPALVAVVIANLRIELLSAEFDQQRQLAAIERLIGGEL